MIYTSENNWYYYSYGDNKPFSTQSSDLEFKTHFGKKNRSIGSFRDELAYAAESVLSLNHTPDLFFSGGVDSEIMLRAFLEIGAKFNVYIVRYENDYNIVDVSYAITICSILNVPYKIIDFNLKNFYNNEAEKISELSQIDRPRALPHCKFLELTDNMPVLGASDLYTFRHSDNYSEKGIWKVFCSEWDTGWSRYTRAIGRQSVPEWFKWTPGLVISYLQLNWYQRLINDEYYGKLGVNSTKIIGYREAFNDLIQRKKYTGFESLDNLINEFENFLSQKYNGLPYRQISIRDINQLKSQILDQ